MAVHQALIEQVTQLVITELGKKGCTIGGGCLVRTMVPVGISARYVHLQQDHLEALFGKGYTLTKRKELSQIGQYAAEETVTLVGLKNKIQKVRILGPLRKETQVEITASEARLLGIIAPVRNSGDLKNTPGLTIVGPKGSIIINQGVIIAERHIHMSPEEARVYQVTNGQKVKVKIPGVKGGMMDNISLRVDKGYRLDFHIDTDDANAFQLQQGQLLELVKE